MYFIVKLFPEITIKSSPVRKRLTRQLRNNLRSLLKPLAPTIDVQRDWEKIEISGPTGDLTLKNEVVRILKNTPGIANFSSVDCYPLGDLDDILDKTLGHWQGNLKGKTFCVRVKRSGNHDFRSTDVERYVGGGILHRTDAKAVRLKNPEVTVNLEIRQDKLFVIQETAPGLGGFPLGSQDSVLSLVSGGFDSTVASYLSIRRGIRTHFCFFNLGGRAHEMGVKQVANFLWNSFSASHRVEFVSVPFESVVAEILQKVDNAYMGVVLKRMMIRAATLIAREMNAGALVTGEAVAQVSSQTLANLKVIDGATDMLTIRPLAFMDKEDIIRIARQIGTEAFAASMPEYCGVISVKPTTRAKPERLVHEEQKFDYAVLDRAVANRRRQTIDRVLEADSSHVQDQQESGVEIFSAPQPDQVVIDIRHPDEVDARPLNAGTVRIINIPFFELSRNYEALDQKKSYLLYCGKGVMSRLHAEILHDLGHSNVGVYRP